MTHSTPASPDASPEMTLWLVNQYALRIDQPGITRHATLAKYLHGRGVRTTVFASGTHYWNVKDNQARTPDASDPTFEYITTSAVESNGVKRVLSMLSFSARTLTRASTRGRTERPDIVLGSSPHPFAALAAWAIARRYRVPFVLEVRDLWPASLVQLMGLSTRHPIVVALSVIERFLYRRASSIITLLPGSERHIVATAGRPCDIVRLPNGVDLTRVPPFAPGPNGDPFVVMYAGAHGIPNSLDTLLEAAEILRADNGRPVRFVLIGSGKEKPRLQSTVQRRGLDNVEFHDAIPKDELLRRLPEADALVIIFRDTDLYREGISPNKVFDYFAAGRPVIIGVRTPVNPVDEAKAGLVIAPENGPALAAAIRELQDMTPAERDDMGKRGRDYVETHYDMSSSAGRLEGVLRRAIAEDTSRVSD